MSACHAAVWKNGDQVSVHLTSVRGHQLLGSHPGRFNPDRRTGGSRSMGSWVDTSIGKQALEKKKKRQQVAEQFGNVM